jgi:hypothetical protein
MKSIIVATLAVLACAIYPPWRPVAPWIIADSDQAPSAAIANQLNRQYFGYVPYGYDWIWRPPIFHTNSGGYSTNLSSGSPTIYQTAPANATMCIDFMALAIQSFFVASAAVLLAIGIPLAPRTLRGLLNLTVAGIAMIVSAGFAFIGFQYAIICARSGLFSIPAAAVVNALVGAVGVAASIALLRFPRKASLIAAGSISIIAITDVQQWMTRISPTADPVFRTVEIGTMVFLAVAIYSLFFRSGIVKDTSYTR